jgi:H+-translocating NAD(P) transhydrogenase subunit alpha
MRVGVIREAAPAEKRVALTPEGAKALASGGFEVLVEASAGVAAGFLDAEYCDAGADVTADSGAVLQASDVVLKVLSPTPEEVGHLREGAVVIGFLFPGSVPETVERLRAGNVTAFAMELIPRITRAQSMDALSSMSTIAGYKAGLLAASRLPKFFPMFMTAAGTLPAARVLVIGAGVAGLQAIATCKRLGAVVEAFDVRPSVKEQVESLGAKFVELEVQMDDAEDASGYAKEVSGTTHLKELELIASRLHRCDAVITTALIPGKRAPILITSEMLARMRRGSVVVDLAAPNGGNCEATVPGETRDVDGITVAGPLTLLSEMALDASRMYSKNIIAFLLNFAPEGTANMNMEDPIIRETLVTHGGKIVHEQTRLKLEREART